jgi:hypothetical protein
VDAHVRDWLDPPNGNERLDQPCVSAFRIYRVSRPHRSTAQRNRHRMEARGAGFDVRCTIVLVVKRCRPMMLVRREPVLVFLVIVIGVGVDVKRRRLARRDGHG